MKAMASATLAATSLTGITDVRMNAATGSLDTTGPTPYFLFSNVRALSKTTSFNDLLKVRYPVNKTSLDLKSSDVQVFKDIGVYDEVYDLFMKNVPALSPMKYGTSTVSYGAGVTHTFSDVNGTKPFIYDLQAGHVMGFTFTSLSKPCYVALTRSATAPSATEYTGLVASNFYQSQLGFLTTGKYYLWLKPQTGGTASVRFSFHNENGTTMSSTSLKSGSIITGSLRSKVRDYTKWKVRLTKDQDLFLNQTAGSNIQWRLLGDDSAAVGSFFRGGSGSTTFAVAVNVPRTGDYYLVAEKAYLDTGSTLRATLSIAP